MSKVLSSLLLLGLVVGISSAACSGDDSVIPQLSVINQSAHRLVVGEVLSINGSYGIGCTARLGNWSVSVSAGAMLQHSALSVVKNDTDCVLTLTEVVTIAGTIPTTSDIALAADYSNRDWQAGRRLDPCASIEGRLIEISEASVATSVNSRSADVVNSSSLSSYASWSVASSS